MRDPHFLLDSIDVNGQMCHLVTREIIEDYILMKESARRQDNIRKVCSKQTALEILSCSEATLYRRLKKKGCKIRKGAVNGTFITASLIAELDK